MQILRYFPNKQEGALKGTFSMKVDKWGIIIHEMKFFEKNGQKWISFPQKIVKGDDSTAKYFPYLQFEHKPHQTAFNDKVLHLLLDYLKSSPIEAKEEIKASQMESPF